MTMILKETCMLQQLSTDHDQYVQNKINSIMDQLAIIK